MELTARQMDIIEAAIKIIAQRGYEKLTTKNLAAQLQFTEAALYRHFPSKHELVKMILCHFENLSCEVLVKIRKDKLNPMDSIRRFVMNRYELFSKNPDMARVMFSEEFFKNDLSFVEQYKSIMQIHKDEVIGYIISAQKDRTINLAYPPIHLFQIILGSMRLIVSQWNMSNCAFDLQKEGSALLETIINMIEVKQ
ncbi:MAG: TetR family transcriptional regulator [Candidatus Cloacimonetes bacterium]|nr:TetR family transcriptional regulator [Candidatus Cloacimonadota bacterium]